MPPIRLVLPIIACLLLAVVLLRRTVGLSDIWFYGLVGGLLFGCLIAVRTALLEQRKHSDDQWPPDAP